MNMYLGPYYYTDCVSLIFTKFNFFLIPKKIIFHHKSEKRKEILVLLLFLIRQLD